MKNQHDELYELGWNDWFEQRAICKSPNTVARVAAVDRDQLLLVDQTGHFRAMLSGSYLHHHRASHELPCVGDWMCVERQRNDDFGVIHALIERRTSLRRKSAGNSTENQMIAANLDYVVIVQSCQFDFNLNRLERYFGRHIKSAKKDLRNGQRVGRRLDRHAVRALPPGSFIGSPINSRLNGKRPCRCSRCESSWQLDPPHSR